MLITDLQGDDDQRTHTLHVAAALEPYRGLDVVRIGPGPEWGVESREAFEAKAQALLARRSGDVLISGEVTATGKGVRLRTLASNRSINARPDPEDGRRPGEYTLTETGLPLQFDRDFNVVLLALVAASVATATDRQGHYLVQILEPAAARLKNLCANMPVSLDQDQRGSVVQAFGRVAYALGEQKGENEWFAEAVQAYRAALEIFSRERVPLEWAAVQNNLGLALSRIGARNRDAERLAQAIAAFRSSLEVRTRERFPLDWALTQSNLGLALLWLGERGSGTERLAQAIAAFRAALSEWTRGRAPLYWAGAQSNLGYALRVLGERQSGASAKESLEQAVAACRASLDEWTRERVPYQWAMAQNKLATALGEREEGTDHLDQALAAFQAALEMFRAIGATHHASGTEANIARTQARRCWPCGGREAPWSESVREPRETIRISSASVCKNVARFHTTSLSRARDDITTDFRCERQNQRLHFNPQYRLAPPFASP